MLATLLTLETLCPGRAPPLPEICCPLAQRLHCLLQRCAGLVGPMLAGVKQLVEGHPPLPDGDSHESSRVAVTPLGGRLSIRLFRTDVGVPPRLQISATEVKYTNISYVLFEPLPAARCNGPPSRGPLGTLETWVVVLWPNLHVPSLLKVAPPLQASSQVVLLGQHRPPRDAANLGDHRVDIMTSSFAGMRRVQPHHTSVHAPPVLPTDCLADELTVTKASSPAAVVQPRRRLHTEQRRGIATDDEVKIQEQQVSVGETQRLNLGEDFRVSRSQRCMTSTN
mmetsp:Transcript_40155/g.106520  ORF Transcript_40155/g.106520 Transcript_40155/m.106520 type:complete len:281 (+) Transcript_40155:413-1255(+)